MQTNIVCNLCYKDYRNPSKHATDVGNLINDEKQVETYFDLLLYSLYESGVRWTSWWH